MSPQVADGPPSARGPPLASGGPILKSRSDRGSEWERNVMDSNNKTSGPPVLPEE